MIYLRSSLKCLLCIDLDVFETVNNDSWSSLCIQLWKSYLDIIFFIYLYQRYIYPVDRTRLNEYGTSGETDSAVVPSDEAQANAEQHEKTD